MSKFVQLDSCIIDLDRVVKILPKEDQYNCIKSLVIYFEDTRTVSIPVKDKDMYFELCNKVTSTNTNEQLIQSMKNYLNCQIWNECKCHYTRDNNDDKYVLVNDTTTKCPCDKWKLKE